MPSAGHSQILGSSTLGAAGSSITAHVWHREYNKDVTEQVRAGPSQSRIRMKTG